MTTHFRPDTDFLRELEQYNAKQEARAKYEADLKRLATYNAPTPHAISVGDRVIVKATRWDGIVEWIDANGWVGVDMDSGPERGLTSFQRDEIEFWSHGR